MKKKTNGNAEGNLKRIGPYVDVQDRIVIVRQLFPKWKLFRIDVG